MALIHTCYRITDPEATVSFYEALGFEERRRVPVRDEGVQIMMGLRGDGERLELMHMFGVESYEIGTGYGHIAIGVTDLSEVLSRLAESSIEPEKPPYRGREGHLLAFVADPDGYRVELIEKRPAAAR
jgi:lactoylglutathione lyase